MTTFVECHYLCLKGDEAQVLQEPHGDVVVIVRLCNASDAMPCWSFYLGNAGSGRLGGGPGQGGYLEPAGILMVIVMMVVTGLIIVMRSSEVNWV